MARFFIDDKNIQNNFINIENEDAKHIKKVLRMKVGEKLTLCDGKGTDYDAEIFELTNNEIKVKIINEFKNIAEPNINVVLFQALPKQGKMEVIIQKCTELGINKIIPFYSRFCTVKPTDKTARWQRVAYEASKQCGRGVIPIVEPCVNFETAVNMLKKMDLGVFCYENEKNTSLKDALKCNYNNIGIMIGSEGGFDTSEVESAKAENVKIVSLGKRILRTETAGMVALSAIMYESGNL